MENCPQSVLKTTLLAKLTSVTYRQLSHRFDYLHYTTIAIVIFRTLLEMYMPHHSV